MIIDPQLLRSIIESALMAYGQPLTIEKLQALFIVEDKKHEDADTQEKKNNSEDAHDVPTKEDILEALEAIEKSCEGRGFELKKVSSGWRFQVRADMASWVNRLWDEKPQRYSRALLETLSIIAYRQPITRGDIEEIRGVAVSSHIIKTLSEREWIKVVGHRDVPGRPSLFATTRQFLDYFNLESLEELPSLRELADIESLSPELDLQTEQAEDGQKDEQAEAAVEEGEVDVSDVTEQNEGDNSEDITAEAHAEDRDLEEHLEDAASDEQGEPSEEAEPLAQEEQNTATDDVEKTHLEDSLRSE